MVVLLRPLLLLKCQHYSFSAGSSFVAFLHVYFFLPHPKPSIPLTQWASGQFARSREPEREADSSPPFDAEVTCSSNLIPLSVSVLCSGTGYLSRLRLKTFMVQDSINHSPTLGHVVRGTSADHPVNSRVDHEFVGWNGINFASEHTGFSLWNLYSVFNFNSALRICLHEQRNNKADEMQEDCTMWIELWKPYLYYSYTFSSLLLQSGILKQNKYSQPDYVLTSIQSTFPLYVLYLSATTI